MWRPSWATRPAPKRRCSSDWKRSFRPMLTVGAPPSAPTPLLVRVHRFGTESLRQGRFSPRGREWAGAPFCPHPLCPPLPRGGRGGTRGSPLPRSGRGAGGEGEKSASVLHAANPSAVPLSATPLSRPAGADKGTTVRCGILGAGAPFRPHLLCSPLPRGRRGGLWSAEARLQRRRKLRFRTPKDCVRLTPLPLGGRGAGVRAYFLRRRSAARPARPAPNASMLAGSGSTRRRNSAVPAPV